MIRYLKRSEINNEKYNSCIENSYNSRIYAFSWYLDCVADNWDALVLNDYEAVMPLPWKQKYLIKYIYPPAWTQQLGVFSINKVSEELVLSFIKAIPKKLRKVTIQFNAENKFFSKNLTKRVNFILSLNRSYEEIYKEFRKDRKARIKESESNNLSIKDGDIRELIKIAEQYYAFLKVDAESYKKLIKISELSLSFVKLVYCENELIGGTLFLKSKKRLTYLFSVVTPKGKNLQATSFIINQTLLKYQKSELVFDFEGSMIKGIADFYKSFGSEIEEYLLYQKSFSFF